MQTMIYEYSRLFVHDSFYEHWIIIVTPIYIPSMYEISQNYDE